MSEDEEATGPSWSFWVGLAVGTAVMAYGIVGLLGASAVTRPRNFATWFLGAGIVHDAVFAPLVVLVGWLTLRVVPGIARNPVRVALGFSVLLVAVTWPLVRRWGARSANPSLLPLDYGRNVVVGLVLIWLVTAAVVVIRLTRARSSSR
jgi:hypothetical protein